VGVVQARRAAGSTRSCPAFAGSNHADPPNIDRAKRDRPAPGVGAQREERSGTPRALGDPRFALLRARLHFEIDNGEPERQLRRVALGRKNFLFAGSDKGAERIAVAYTLLGTCHMNGVNPLAYLTDVFGKLQAGWPKARLDELLPQNWKPA
jgi:hypothetical protein